MHSYDVILTKGAQKIYKRLTAKLRHGIDQCIVYLEVNPTWGPNVKKLAGEPGCYRYQVGGWRILYEVDETTREVRIYDIRPRGDVYKH
ncbi:MAG: type II toxin-antitoxin system RelE/ParE family toxin [Syntrophothermus sp.]|uniref:type II toxin-antitoxin system RelE family toxin n=1 Tax=Syntrophothermus sp. TaxID=2736299 RepID=UPI00257DD40C|nr:type II toxin-antitoxin system RelE/ParE family toxin [Syntrophothermus sp.]NSW83181.1 type II toxin-antitoxin system RelE/ParE family toxin [Syntrophothermus sp.]